MKLFILLTSVLLSINIPLFSQTDFNIYSKASGKVDIELQKIKADKFYNQNLIDSAVTCYSTIYSIATKTNDSLNICYSLKELGSMQDILGNYSKALEHLMRASQIAKEKSYFQLLAATEINIGIVYFNLKKSEQAIAYCNSALNTGETIHDTIIMVKALNNLGNAYLTLLGDMQNAESCFNRSVELARLLGFEQAVTVGLNNLCQIYMNSGREFDAKAITDKMLKQYPSNPFIYYNIGNLYRQNQNNSQAKESFIKALSLSMFETELQMVLLKDISDIEKESANFESALSYYQSYIALKDSIHSVEQSKNIAELETKYKLLEKEKTISELQAKTLRTERTNTIIVASAVTASLIFLLLILYFTGKRKIAAEKIKSLENEQKIIAFTATLKGEEKERARLSAELHDGLGGILSAARMNVENQLSAIETKENQSNYQLKTHKLIVESISEMRRISNALLPETLIKFGLKTAIKSYCNTFNTNNSGTNTEFSFFGTELRYSSHFELTVYRIVQEVVNNAIKHSGATQISVQMICDKNRLFIGINDNGKGFDSNLASSRVGLGLGNIKQRAEIYGGRAEIISSLGTGTEVIIEFDDLINNKTVYDTNNDS